MCYNIELETKEERYIRRYKAELLALEILEKIPKIQFGFDHGKIPLILNSNPNKIELIRWGLVPTGTSIDKAKEIQNFTLNARNDKLLIRNSYKNILDRRCLILVSAFFEHKHIGKKKTELHRISHFDDEMMCLGGLWTFWQNPKNGLYTRTFTIITTEANDLMKTIHNKTKGDERMPLIIPKELESDWLLNDKKMFDIIKPYDQNLLKTQLVA